MIQIADLDQEFHFNTTKVKKDQILSILEQDCKFFESILEEVNPDYLCIPLIDRHHNQLLHKICKSKGIKILMLVPTRLGTRWMLAEELDQIDPDVNYDDIKYEKKSFEQLQKYLQDFVHFKNACKINTLYKITNQEKICF